MTPTVISTRCSGAVHPPHGPWVTTWLGAPRWHRYLAAADGDEAFALALYEWNAAVSASLLHDLAHLEVALRNAYDRALSQSSAWRDWTTEPDVTFPPLWRTDLYRAFPVGTARTFVDIRVGDLYRLRNRVAHHEPVLSWDIGGSYRRLLDVAGLVAEEIAAHVSATSAVPHLLVRRPRPRRST